MFMAVAAITAAHLASAQLWKSLLKPDQAIDWSGAGVGSIPTRVVHCAELTPAAGMAQINAELASCPAGNSVLLAAGAYQIAGTLRVPSNVTLRGAGADKTILNATGSGEAVIALGSGSVPFQPRAVRRGTSSGSTELVLGSTDEIRAGTYLVITEENDPRFVTAAGSGGNCNWCDGGWSKNGRFARGQIVTVTAVEGDRVTISPGLYGGYKHSPIAVPFAMAAEKAGVEDLQVRANNTGYSASFQMTMCAYCWIKGVESNYADGDHVAVLWGFHDEIRDSYFSNAFQHVPGEHESDIQIGLKTSATLIENNIIERTHSAVMLQWGAAGNVIAYNYTLGEFDSEAPNVVIGGVDYHGAHPQYNLIEGNVMTAFYADSVWGSSSDTSAFRNWFIGTNRVCEPLQGRGAVTCAGKAGHYGFQAARAVQFSYLGTRNNFIGNVVGSAQMQALIGYSRPIPQSVSVEYPAERPYETAALWSFGFGSANDDGTGTGCGGGVPPCHAEHNAAAQFLHGNYNNRSGAVEWAAGIPRELPASFYLADKPAWWGSLPFPAIGTDVHGGTGPGGHSFGNPAEHCYRVAMRGADGGVGSPLRFNAGECYTGIPGSISALTSGHASPE